MKKIIPILMASLCLLAIPFQALTQAPDLGASSTFTLFTAVGAFDNLGASIVTGDIGTDAGAFSGFPPGTVIGEIHVADPVSAQAAIDVDAAYGFLDGLTCGTVIGTTLGNNQVLTPDTYCLGAASTLNATLILDGENDPNSIFIFQIDGALSTSTFANILLINSASLCNVYWQINGAFTLGDSAVFQGTLLVNGAIHLLEGSSLLGRALSRSGAIDLHNNVVTIGLPPVADIISADGPLSFCEGDSVVLSGNTNGTWNNGSSNESITVYADGEFYSITTNGCGSDTSEHFFVSVIQDVPPEITCPADITLDCLANTLPVSTGIATATDSCGMANITFTEIIISGLCPQEFVITRIWTATDNNGNTATCEQIISISDTTPPLITCPANVTITCEESTQPATNGTATAIENCDAFPLVSFTDVTIPGSCAQEFTIDRTWTAIDECGNSATCIQTITVVSNELPSITCPPGITVSCIDLIPAPDGLGVIASGSCGASMIVTHLGDVVSNEICTNSFVVTRTYQASDACGNTATCLQVINVLDITTPVISFSDPAIAGLDNGDTLVIQCFGQNPEWNLPAFGPGSITATDNCAAETQIQFQQTVEGEGNCDVDGFIILYRLTWTITDACDNSSSAVLFLSVIDTIAPQIFGVPGDITVSCNAIPETFDAAYATDGCLCACVMMTESTNLVAGCQDGQVIVRTWSSTDDCGNLAIETQTITLIDDTGPHLQLIPAELTDIQDGSIVEFTCSTGGIPSYFDQLNENSISNTESCGGIADIDFKKSIQTPANCAFFGFVEEQTFSWTSTDLCGNTSSFTVIARLIDTEPPVLSGIPEMTCVGDPMLQNIEAVDNCGNAMVRFWDVSIPNPCGSGLAVRRTYEAYDNCGNMSRDTAILITDDQQSPVIVLTNPALLLMQDTGIMVMNCTGQQGGYTPFGTQDIFVEETCFSGSTITFSEKLLQSYDCTGENNLLALVEVSWVVTDFCGNLSELVFVVQIVDNSSPVFTDFDAELSIHCMESLPAIHATDNCGEVTMTSTEEIIPGVCISEYDVLRRITIIDPCGNTAVRTQTIHVVNPGPVISGVVEEVCNDLTLPVVTAYDACNQTTVPVFMTEDTIDNPCNNGLIIERIWSASGACGQTTTIRQLITIDDHVSPEIQIPTHSVIHQFLNNINNEVALTDDILSKLNSLDEYSIYVRNECDPSIRILFSVDTIALDCSLDGFFERRIYKWIVTEACADADSISFTIDIMDDVPPVFIETPRDITIVCAPLPGVPVLVVTDADSSIVIVFTETIMPADASGALTIVRQWVASDECGNTTTHTQRITWIENTLLECGIILPDVIECNAHGIWISTMVTGGISPFTYAWEVEGEKCFIQSGQGTPDIRIYVGWTDVEVILTITDSAGCISICSNTIECTISQNPFIAIPQNVPGSFQDIQTIESVGPNGIAEPDISEIKVWPNPAYHSLSVSFDSGREEEVSITILDLVGQIVYTQKRTTDAGYNSYHINVSDLKPAAYILYVKSASQVQTKMMTVAN